MFRSAKVEEVRSVYSLVVKHVHWMDDVGIRQWNVTNYLEAYPLEYYEEQQAAGRLYVLANREIVGAVVLLEADERWNDRADDSAYYVHNLATDPDVKGAGREILKAIEQLAVEQEKRYIRLDCATDNTFLNSYYSSMGYQFAGTCEEGLYKGNRREKEIR